MNWNWVWSLKSVTFNNCGVGVNSKALFSFILPFDVPPYLSAYGLADH